MNSPWALAEVAGLLNVPQEVAGLGRRPRSPHRPPQTSNSRLDVLAKNEEFSVVWRGSA